MLPESPVDLSTFSGLQLQDQNGEVIAFFRPTRQTRYQIGDVFGELHFIRSAGAGTVVRAYSQALRSSMLTQLFPFTTTIDAPSNHGYSDSDRHVVPILCCMGAIKSPGLIESSHRDYLHLYNTCHYVAYITQINLLTVHAPGK